MFNRSTLSLAISFIFLTALDAMHARAAQSVRDLKREERIANIRSQFGVEVVFDYSPSRYFPGEWLVEPLWASGTQIEAGGVDRLLPEIEDFLSYHPSRIVKHNLKTIYLLRDLVIYGKEYGGTVNRDAIYLRFHYEDPAYTDARILEVLHHEFSSILMGHYAFPEREWDRINPSGFEYRNNALEYVDHPHRFDQSEVLLLDGFLTEYSKASMEEDFNEISGKVLLTPDWKTRVDALSRYDRIRAKLVLARRFYTSIDRAYGFGHDQPSQLGLIVIVIFFASAVAATIRRYARTRA